MTATSHWRGNKIYFDEAVREWKYSDDGSLVKDVDKPCGHCGHERTPEGHDHCFGTLPGVVNACCGHGEPEDAYIQFENGIEVRGFDVVRRFREGAAS